MPITILNPPNNQGLVGWWKFDENGGTTAHDFSGNGNHGKFVGNSVWTWFDGVLGKALNFDGGNQYINIPDSNIISLTGNFTISAWIKTNSNTTQQAIVEKYTNPGINGYLLRITSAGKLLSCSQDGATETCITGNTILNIKTWYHVVVVYNGSTIKTFINAIQDNSIVNTRNPTDGTSTLKIGGRGDDGSLTFNGLMDDVRIYNKALSAAEVWSLYNSN